MGGQSFSRFYSSLKIGLIAILFISSVFFAACDDDNNNNNSSTVLQQETLTEHDFFNNRDLRANPEVGVVTAFLEPPSASEKDNLTGELGYDVFRYRYDRALNHRFCFINSDEGSKHSLKLQGLGGKEILSTEAEDDCVEARVEPGHYNLVLTHGEHVDVIDNMFLITMADSQEFGMRETIKQSSFVGFFESIRNIFTREAIAQSADDNVITLVSTNSCVGCDLSGVDLTGNDFTSANLTAANLSGSSLSGVSFSQANLQSAILTGADLSDTNGTTDLSRAQMIGANLSNADLTGADFSDANLSLAIFIGADVTDATFDNSILTSAIWTNGGLCLPGSIGFCLNTLLDGPKVCDSVRQDFTDDGTKVYKCLLPSVEKETCVRVEESCKGCTSLECTATDEEDLVFSVDLEDIMDQANSKFSANLGNNTPIAIMAWGGEGAPGGDGYFASGGNAGEGGFASMTTTVSDFQDKYGQTSFFFYIGEAGTLHDGSVQAGGGSGTLVMLVESNPRSLNDIVLLAGGGGGGEEGGFTSKGSGGGFGGVAASSEKGLRVTGQGRHTDGGNVVGGAQGIGGRGAGDGHDGIGGRGGKPDEGVNKEWVNGDPGVGSDGQGGNGSSFNGGGAGGGGHGGGGGGDGSSGAGGGSWIDRSTITCHSAPMVDDNPLNNDDAPPNPGTVNEDDSNLNGAVEVWIFPDGCG